jgi:hypothetical protein
MTLSVRGTRIEDNDVRAYGSAIFFVGNDHSGTIELRYSVIRHNKGGGWNVRPASRCTTTPNACCARRSELYRIRHQLWLTRLAWVGTDRRLSPSRAASNPRRCAL